MLLRDLGEFGFIGRISALCKIHGSDVIRGIGDDCAIIKISPHENLLITTDIMVERVHFQINLQTARSIGAKALAVNLSDIAACGGTPKQAFVSIAIPEHLDVAWLEDLYRGISELAAEFEVDILGGDTTRSLTDLVINILVTGLTRNDETLFRNGAQQGDVIAISGPLGHSAAGLELLQKPRESSTQIYSPLINAHLQPKPHISVGRILAESGACNAAIDISDGLSSDLGHLCKQSGLGATIFEETIPVAELLRQASRELTADCLEWILNGGEDYVLLAAIRPQKFREVKLAATEAGADLIEIGQFVSGSEMKLIKKSGIVVDLVPKGWDHFRS